MANLNEKTAKEQIKLQKMVANLAAMIEDGTKPLWKSKTAWAAVLFGAVSGAAAYFDGADYRTAVGIGFAALVIGLRTVTTKAIR